MYCGAMERSGCCGDYPRGSCYEFRRKNRIFLCRGVLEVSAVRVCRKILGKNCKMSTRGTEGMHNGVVKKKQSGLRTLLEKINANTKPLQGFFNKFNNYWDMNSAAGLAYNLITAIVPIFVALIAIVGLTIGNLNAQATANLIARIQQIFPESLHTTDIVGIALKSLSQRAGALGI